MRFNQIASQLYMSYIMLVDIPKMFYSEPCCFSFVFLSFWTPAISGESLKSYIYKHIGSQVNVSMCLFIAALAPLLRGLWKYLWIIYVMLYADKLAIGPLLILFSAKKKKLFPKIAITTYRLEAMRRKLMVFSCLWDS